MAGEAANSERSPAAPSAGAVGARPGAAHVPRPNGACVVSGQTIAPGEKFMAGVRETPAGLERLDVAMEHWNAFAAERGAELLGFWQTVMPRAEHKKKVFVDDEVLCALFERLSEATEPLKLAFRFVLGLILMRKRLVIYESTRHDPPDGPDGAGRDVWIVRMKGSNDRLDLIDPKLDEKQVAQVSQQLGEILNQEL